MSAATSPAASPVMSPAQLRERVEAFLTEHPPATTDRGEFLHARYAAGLAWVHFPEGHGGLGLPRGLQPMVESLFVAAGAPDNNPRTNGIGLGMVAPTLLGYGSEEQRRRFLEPLWCGEEIWCQLFSEPGAGSDLAGLATRAVPDGDGWVVNGQKVWTSGAHNADLAILVARTDPDVPKHRGITYFVVDMHDPGVDVRPLRQITGEAEFNEVFLTDVRIPDSMRVGEVGDGWRVANGTLNNERVAIGGHALPREGGMLGVVAQSWRERPEQHTPELHDRLMRLWVESEVARLTGQRLRQQLAAGQPGPAGSAMKLTFARLNQQLSGLDLEIRGEDGLRYDEPGWEMRRPQQVDFTGRDAVYRYLRAKGNSIEGGTSEILRNIVAERVLGLPAEPRVDKDVPWNEVPR
jgi:alkylation response protein AidB-like acyl-CoA dehydrogenase